MRDASIEVGEDAEDDVSEKAAHGDSHDDDLTSATESSIEGPELQQTVPSKQLTSIAAIEELKTSIETWLEAPNSHNIHAAASLMIHPGTCQWILQDKDFVQWRDGHFRTLWVYGIPGCGKTVLCSFIIETLRHIPGNVTVFHHCNFKDMESSRPDWLLRSITTQLLQFCHTEPLALQDAYQERHTKPGRPSANQLLDSISSMASELDKEIYVVLDAIEEFADFSAVKEIFDSLTKSSGRLHLLFTSRQEVAFDSYLFDYLNHSLDLHFSEGLKGDIKTYLESTLHAERIPEEVKSKITEKIDHGAAENMFLWAKAQLDATMKCTHAKEVERVLCKLPKTVDQLYTGILSSIPSGHTLGAAKMFQWLCFCDRPMTLVELLEVIEFDLEPVRGNRISEPMELARACGSLIRIEDYDRAKPRTIPQVGMVRLCHHSVREYLLSIHPQQKRLGAYHVAQNSANISIARTCLNYLLSMKVSKAEAQRTLTQYPLAWYAAKSWAIHYREVVNHSGREELDNCATQLVNRTELFQWWLQICGIEDDGMVPPAIYHMSRLGITGVVRKLLEEGASADELPPGQYGTALGAACYAGYEDVVRLLLAYGAEVNNISPDEKEPRLKYTPLFFAVRGERETIVRLLLDHGANVDFGGPGAYSPLLYSTGAGFEQMVQLLIEYNADVNYQDMELKTPLHVAARGLDEEIVQLLLRAGADTESRDSESNTPLHMATDVGRAETVQLLLSAGADVNAVNSEGLTPLDIALQPIRKGPDEKFEELNVMNGKRRESVARLLAAHGADIDGLYGSHGTRLQKAAKSGDERAVRVLLAAGADPNVYREGVPFPHYEPGSPLHEATNNETLVKMLLAAGADVNFRCPSGIPLQWAAGHGNVDIVRLLIDAGADIRNDDNALRNAVMGEHKDVLRLLLENGADPNLDSSVNPNSKSPSGRSLLKTASRSKSMQQLLLDYGATEVQYEKEPKQAGGPGERKVI